MYAVRRPVENRYLVRERDRRRGREFLAFSLALLPPMAVLFAAIWANVETVKLGYQLERLQAQLETLTRRNQNLQAERAQAASLGRVEAVARQKLGLGPAVPAQVIEIREGTSGTPRVEAPPVPTPEPTPELVGPPAPESNEEGF